MSQIFRFKQFEINQDKTAMKVGTDGVLLGAWCTIQKDMNSILDIGSGTGLISLMLAQRSFSETIDAVEIDENAYEQTVENFENSVWGDRLFCYNCNFLEFVEEMYGENERYDLIVSNPPFYTDKFESENLFRNKARFTSSLSFIDLIKGASLLLSDNGIFSVIIPKKEQDRFIELAKEENLFLKRICHVKGNFTSESKRSLLEFSFTQSEIIKEELIIENERHNYTEDYINLTEDFYLKM